MIVIALSGKKRAGKDTAADYLVRMHSYVKLSFASALKDMVAVQYDVPRHWMDDQKYKEAPLCQYPVITTDAFTEVTHKYLSKEFVRDEKGVLSWTPRALCILEGSVKRSVNSAYWTQQVIDRVNREQKDPLIKQSWKDKVAYVISDVRYKSEMQQLKQAFGANLITLRINREGTAVSDDASECDLDGYSFDEVIDNTNISIIEYIKLIDYFRSKYV